MAMESLNMLMPKHKNLGSLVIAVNAEGVLVYELIRDLV